MVVLITGASKGIGQATAVKFAKEGYNVVVNYFSSFDGALATKQLVEKYNVECMIYKCDVSKEHEVKDMIDNIILKFGKIDCVVNNAGIAIDTLPLEKNVNVIGVYLVSKYASKYMDKGSIINISSTNGLNSYYPYSLDYDASKAGVISLTHNFATLLAPNIRVNAVTPGWVNTEMNKELDEDYIKEECKNIFLNRFAEPVEVANVIYFLASSESSYINNSIIRVDGGLNGSC